jgi:hypothetical protein
MGFVSFVDSFLLSVVYYSYIHPLPRPHFQSELLRNVLVRFGATMGSVALSLTADELVVVELERRVFCWTWMSLVREESELSGMVSGATVAAEKVAW